MSVLWQAGVPHILSRPRLIEQVERALQVGDLIVVAGAGFGKRSLIGTWLSRAEAPPVIHLDPDASLPANDWNGVVVAEPSNAAALAVMGSVQRNWRMIMIAPYLPDSDRSIALLNGTLGVLDAEHLLMSYDELAELFPHAGSARLAQILKWTGGWPIAVQALARRYAMDSSSENWLQAAYDGLSASLYDFCENHVLADASALDLDLLKCLCIVQEVDQALAEALAGSDAGVAALAAGTRFGLIRRMPDKPACWQLIHPVLARHIQTLADIKEPDTSRLLHARASECCVASGKLELAIFHARSCENWSQLADLIVRAGGWRLAVDWRNRQADRDWLHNCVEDIPEWFVEESVVLRLARAMLRHCSGDFQRAMRDYETLSVIQPQLEESLAREIEIVGQLMRMLEERPPTANERAAIEVNLKKVSSSDILGIALLENALAIAAAQRGETTLALEAGDRAGRLYARLESPVPVSVVNLVQGRAFADAGLRNLALNYFQSGLKAFEYQLGGHSDLARCARLLIAQEQFIGNDVEAAKHNLDAVLPWVQTQEPQFHAAAFLTTARIAALESGLETAAEVIDNCIRFAQRGGFDRLERLAQICWLEQLIMADEADLAARLAVQIDLNALAVDRTDRLLAFSALTTCIGLEIATGKVESARDRLEALRDSVERKDSPALNVQYNILGSLTALQMSENDRALNKLCEALRHGVKEGLARHFVERGRWILPVLREHQKMAQRKGRFANHAEDEFVAEVIASIRKERRLHRLAVEGISLTEKESEIASLLVRGLSNKEIGRLIGASDNTVKWHLKNMFRHFGVVSRADLATAYLVNVERRTSHNMVVSLSSFRLQ